MRTAEAEARHKGQLAVEHAGHHRDRHNFLIKQHRADHWNELGRTLHAQGESDRIKCARRPKKCTHRGVDRFELDLFRFGKVLHKVPGPLLRLRLAATLYVSCNTAQRVR